MRLAGNGFTHPKNGQPQLQLNLNLQTTTQTAAITDLSLDQEHQNINPWAWNELQVKNTTSIDHVYGELREISPGLS